MNEGVIKTRQYGLIVSLIYIGYLLYDKNQNISILLMLIGMVLGIHIIISDSNIKKEKHEYEIDKWGQRRR